MIKCAARTSMMARSKVCVYQGYGVYEKDSIILHRELTRHLKKASNLVTYVTPEEINEGILQRDVALLAVGGGFDLGLIKALGPHGVSRIKQFVYAGGSYLGICSGAYFACDYIQFDKGGPLEVIGERFLKFYPGVSIGPLYKPYVYDSTKGAVTALVSFQLDDELTVFQNSTHETSNALTETSREDTHHQRADRTTTCIYGNSETPDRESQNMCNGCQVPENVTCCVNNVKDDGNCTIKKHEEVSFGSVDSLNKPDRKPEHECIKILFNGGGCFLEENMQVFLESQKFPVTTNDETIQERNNSNCLGLSRHPDGESLKNVSILSRYLDLPSQPIAMVKCRVGDGVAILSGGHFEYNADDIDCDDGDDMNEIINNLRESKSQRTKLFRSVLKQLNMSVGIQSELG